MVYRFVMEYWVRKKSSCMFENTIKREKEESKKLLKSQHFPPTNNLHQLIPFTIQSTLKMLSWMGRGVILRMFFTEALGEATWSLWSVHISVTKLMLCLLEAAFVEGSTWTLKGPRTWERKKMTSVILIRTPSYLWVTWSRPGPITLSVWSRSRTTPSSASSDVSLMTSFFGEF